MKPGIPTEYAGVRFRSRLEAHWAAFFDLLGWPWEYEPFDLAGYIPDFVLKFEHGVGELLVEVKPEATSDGLRQHTAKLASSGWKHDAVLVGSSLLRDEGGVVGLGLAGTYLSPELFRYSPGLVFRGDLAWIFACLACERVYPSGASSRRRATNEPWECCSLCGADNRAILDRPIIAPDAVLRIPLLLSRCAMDRNILGEALEKRWATAKNRVQWRGGTEG